MCEGVKRMYLNYVKECKGNCNKCNNYRMYYLYTNVTHMLFASCNKCYTGKNDDVFCIDDELMFYHQYAFENEELKTRINSLQKEMDLLKGENKK